MDAASFSDRLTRAGQILADGPLSTRTLRAVEALYVPSPSERAVDRAANYLAKLVVRGPSPALQFREVSSDRDWERVRELRKRCYPTALPYLVSQLDERGGDPHDRHSFVFAAFLGEQAVATIRATVYPYETLDYVSEAKLAAFLGPGWQTEYIEWGRLLVERRYAGMRLLPALITFAGLRVLALTKYRYYFGYTRPSTRKLIAKFALDGDELEFGIPQRGSHTYSVSKGSFKAALFREMPKWLRVSLTNEQLQVKHVSV